jgi:hypothetical protein
MHPIPPTERWTAGVANTADFLQFFAREMNDRANLYNAAKHGLAVRVADDAPLRLTLANGVNIIDQDGPALAYLEERRDDNDGADVVHLTTAWTDLETTIGFIYVATNMIDALWRVARWRYVKAPLQRIEFFDRPLLSELLDVRVKKLKTPYFVPHFAHPLPVAFARSTTSGRAARDGKKGRRPGTASAGTPPTA